MEREFGGNAEMPTNSGESCQGERKQGKRKKKLKAGKRIRR